MRCKARIALRTRGSWVRFLPGAPINQGVICLTPFFLEIAFRGPLRGPRRSCFNSAGARWPDRGPPLRRSCEKGSARTNESELVWHHRSARREPAVPSVRGANSQTPEAEFMWSTYICGRSREHCTRSLRRIRSGSSAPARRQPFSRLSSRCD